MDVRTHTNAKWPTAGQAQAIAQEAYVYAFPIVQNYLSIYQLALDPNWSQYKGPPNEVHNIARVFTPADTVIVNGLHGALLLAPRHPAGFGSATDWVSNLAGFEIDLLRDGAVIDRGHAANVLDGPLSALRHLVRLLASDPVNSPLATGDIVTTGTLTRAFPILPGESWGTTLHGIELGGRPVWFA